MKAMTYNFKYLLIGILCMGITACTNDSDEPNPVVKNEISRSTITVERTVDLTTTGPGTLQEVLENLIDDVSTLQKLTLVGPYNGYDVQYWKSALPNLIEFDLSDAIPTETVNDVTIIDEWSNECRQLNNQIMVYSFSDMTYLEKLVFPSCVHYIDRWACRGCTNLMEIIFNEGLINIGNYAFEGCTNLDNVLFPSTLKYINYGAFNSCGLTSIELPFTVESVDGSSFRDCHKLKKVKFLANVSSIGDYMFSNCTELESIELSSTIVDVGYNAFEDCLSLKSFPFSQINILNHSSFHHSGIEEADLSNVTDFSNASWCFRLCESLKKVILPNNATSLASTMFWGCTSLTDINFPTALETINDELFGGCPFTELIIPSSVKNIGNTAFASNPSLKKVVLHDAIETLGNNCFENCDNLASVTLPSQLKVLPNSIFWSCDSLKSITLPSTLEKIGNAAFGDSGLESINIPSSVTTIEAQAFRNTKLTSLEIPETVTNVTSKIVDWCQHLKYIIWKTSVNFDDVDNFNYNCYLFINKNITTGPNWHDKNVFRKEDDGKYYIDTFRLDVNIERRNQNLSIYIPEDFTAKNVIYERVIGDWTYPGISSGWQTIVLPFSPTKIRHKEKGEIAPFNKEVEGNRHFWLRELTKEGWKDRTEMVANVPYIIAMPNHDSYMDEYRLNGNIIFSAENIEFKKNTDVDSNSVLPPSEGADYNFQPTFNYVEKDESVYALNVDCWINGYHYGSVFAKYSQDVFAFEAYVTTNGRSARATFGIDTSSDNTRSAKEKNTTGIPQIGDM